MKSCKEMYPVTKGTSTNTPAPKPHEHYGREGRETVRARGTGSVATRQCLLGMSQVAPIKSHQNE